MALLKEQELTDLSQLALDLPKSVTEAASKSNPQVKGISATKKLVLREHPKIRTNSHISTQTPLKILGESALRAKFLPMSIAESFTLRWSRMINRVTIVAFQKRNNPMPTPICIQLSID